MPPLLIIDFLDHCHTSGAVSPPVPIRVVGWLIHETETYYQIATWIAENELQGDNSDSYTIVKHAGIKVTPVNA